MAALSCTATALVFIGGLWVCVVTFMSPTFTAFRKHWGWLNTTTLTGVVITDSLIAGSLCYYLIRTRFRMKKYATLCVELIKPNNHDGFQTFETH